MALGDPLCADAKDYFVPRGAESVNFNDIEVKFTILMLPGPFVAPVPTPKT